MKISAILAVAGIVSVGSAQSISSLVATLPTCAITCFTKFVPKFCPSVLDYGCQCSKVNQLTNAITPCILAGCSTQEALDTRKTAAKICSVYSAMQAGGGGGGGGGSSSSNSESMTKSSGGNSGGGSPGSMTQEPKPTPPPQAPKPSSSTKTATSTFTGVGGGVPRATAGSMGAAVAAAAIAFAL